MKTCKKLIDLAVVAGCNTVKFQKRDINLVYSKKYLDSYRESPLGKTLKRSKKGLEFSKVEHKEIDTIKKKKLIGLLPCLGFKANYF